MFSGVQKETCGMKWVNENHDPETYLESSPAPMIELFYERS